MAEKTRNLNIKFGADTTGFSRGVAEMRGELADLNSALMQNKRKQKEYEETIKAAEKEIRKIRETQRKTNTVTKEQHDRIKELEGVIDGTTLQLAGLKAEEAELKGKVRATTKEIVDQTDETKLSAKADKEKAEAQKTLKDSMEKVGNVLKKTAELTGTAMAALFTYSAGMAASADDINTLAKQTGLSTEEIQKFMYASSLIDVELETLTGSMAKLVKNMSTATSGTGDAYDAFVALGVSITDNTGVLRNNQEVFDECIEALSRIQDETQRDAYAMAIFGKSAQDLNPLILGGTQQLKEFGDELEREGLILDQVQLDKLNEFNDKIDTFKAKFQAQMMLSATDAIDAFDELFEKSDEIIDLVATLIEGFAKFTGFVVDHKEAVLALVVAYGTFKTVKAAGDVIHSVVTATRTLTTATQAATTAQHAQNAAVSSHPYVILLSALAAVAGAMITYAVTTKEATSATEELKQGIEDAVVEAEAENEMLRRKGEKYEELRKKAKRTTEEEEMLHKIASDLETSYPNQIELIDEKTGAYKELGSQIEEVTTKLLKQAKAEASLDALKNAYAQRISLANKYFENIKNDIPENIYNEIVAPIQNEYVSSGYDFKVLEDNKYALYTGKSILDGAFAEDTERMEREDIFNQLSANYQLIIGLEKEYGNQIEATIKQNGDATEETEAFSGKLIELCELYSFVNKAEKELTETNKLSADTLNKLASEYPELQKIIQAYIDGEKTAEDVVNELSKAYEGYATSCSEGSEQLCNEMLAFVESLYLVTNAEHELATTNVLSAETLNTLIEKYPELQNEVNNYIEGKKTATDVINALNIAYQNDVGNNASALQSKLNTDAEYFQKLRQMNSSVINNLASQYGVDLSNYENYAEAKLAIEKAFLTSKAKNWALYYDAESQRYKMSDRDLMQYKKELMLSGMSQYDAGGVIAKYKAERDATIAAVNAWNNLSLTADLSDYYKQYIPTITKPDGGNGSNLGSTSTKKELSVYELANAALKELVDDRIEELNRLNEAEKTAAQERIAAIEAEIEARKELSETDDLQKRIDFLKGELKYSMLDDFERAELQRQLDDLLTEQADREWEKAKRAEIEGIRLQQEQTNAEHQALIEQIQAAQNYANTKLTDLQNGYQSASSVVSNNSTHANITIVNSALTEGQVRKIFGDLLGPGVIT